MKLHAFDLLFTQNIYIYIYIYILQCISTNLKVQMLSDEIENC